MLQYVWCSPHLPAGCAVAVHDESVWVVQLPAPAQLKGQHVVPAHCKQRSVVGQGGEPQVDI